jgi:hypothetical protein
VVTSYEFQVHPVGPRIVGGMLLHPLEQAGEVLHSYRDYVDNAPDELATPFAPLTAPPKPLVPEHLHGRPALGIIACHCGDIAEGERAVRPFKALRPPPST